MTARLHTCVLCEAVCGLALEVEGGAIRSVRGDRDDPFSRGHVCPKAAAIPDVVGDPDRVRTPLRRTGDRFVEVGWDEALDEAATRLGGIQRAHGRSAVGLYLGNPTVHSYSALLAAPLLSKVLGSRARYSATSLDQLPQMLAALEMLGHQLLLTVPDVERTRFLLVLGANPAVSNGSLLTLPGVADRLRALRARGGRVVVVDPRRSETAALADEHLAIRPGGDAALLAALLQVILAEGLGRPPALPLAGEDALRAAVAPFTPERVAARTGLAPERVRALARAFAAARPAVAYGRVGLCTQVHGGVAAWLLLALNAVTGNLDAEGGAMIATPAADLVGLGSRLGERGSFGRWRSRVRGLPEFGGELPAAALAEEVETPGEGQVRGLVTFAGNPVLSAPNGRRLDRALAKLEFMVSIDLHVNATTRHAHLILPTSFGPERDHHDLAFYALAGRNAARWAEAVVAPPPGVRHDWQVLADLGLRLHARGGGRRRLGPALALRALRTFGPRRVLDLLLRLGPHRLSLAKLRAAPHGLDLGPLRPGALARALATPDRKVALAPPRLAAGLADVEADLAGGPEGLVLVGRRTLRSNNSWLANSPRLVKGPTGCTLLMHPDDAGRRGLADGARVRVRSRAGEIEVPLRVSDEVAPGVVSLPHGWGHDRPGVALRVAAAAGGASVNDVTDEALVDPLSGTAALSGVPVEVSAAG
ncbi:MAG: molybdopterin-dependent oxidoreductase [Anaeromyxobacter sp.]